MRKKVIKKEQQGLTKGIKVVATGEIKDCCICGKKIICTNIYWGNNPDPLGEAGKDYCCDNCNWFKVIPARIAVSEVIKKYGSPAQTKNGNNGGKENE